MSIDTIKQGDARGDLSLPGKLIILGSGALKIGEAGEFVDHLEVWGRAGALSSRSRTPIKRVKFGGEWTYFCETQV